MHANLSLKAVVLALALAGMGPAVAADSTSTSTSQLTTQSNTMDQLSTTQEPSKVTTKFASDFATFAGSQENAEAMITGLRNGTPITLANTSTTSGGTTTGGTTSGSTTGGTSTTTTSTTIIPPTKPMGYGETYISMSLAKAQLASYGITNPTPEQLQAAMTGGTFTVTKIAADGTTTTETLTIDGILNQRASGMGWGQIANANGFKLGRVISAMKSANKSLAATDPKASGGAAATAQAKVKPEASSSKGGGYSQSSGRGITTALGGGGVVYGKSHGKSGTQVASLNSQGAGKGNYGQGAGISTAAGGAAVHGNAGGNSANAPGQNKGPK